MNDRRRMSSKPRERAACFPLQIHFITAKAFLVHGTKAFESTVKGQLHRSRGNFTPLLTEVSALSRAQLLAPARVISSIALESIYD